jgi:hypothetical protein
MTFFILDTLLLLPVGSRNLPNEFKVVSQEIKRRIREEPKALIYALPCSSSSLQQLQSTELENNENRPCCRTDDVALVTRYQSNKYFYVHEAFKSDCLYISVSVSGCV